MLPYPWEYIHRPDSVLEDSDDERERQEEQRREREENLKQFQTVVNVAAREFEQLSRTIDEDTKETVQCELILLRMLMKAKLGELDVEYILLNSTALPEDC